MEQLFFQRLFRFFLSKMYISRPILDTFSKLFRVPLEDVLGHLLWKTQKKLKKLNLSKNFAQFFFSAIFSNFLSKKVYFSNITRYFFLVVSRPLRRVIKTFSEKNSKKNKKFILCKKFRTIFFSAISRFFEVCRSGDLVNFLEVCRSGVLEEISLLTNLDSS